LPFGADKSSTPETKRGGRAVRRASTAKAG
jgi:hypothetical protein